MDPEGHFVILDAMIDFLELILIVLYIPPPPK